MDAHQSGQASEYIPGRHFLYDFHGCDPKILDDKEKLREILLEAVRLTGAKIISDIFHKFSPQGVTGVIAIAESHVAIHTWPELGFAAVDAFTCSHSMRVDLLESHLKGFLRAQKVIETEVDRGRAFRTLPKQA